jgi:DNA-binding NarL/FixJ family response regulator
MSIRIGIIDDHQLFLKSLSFMLQSFHKYDIVLEALNGRDMQPKIANLPIPPDMILIDVNMPVMDGIATAQWLQEQYPTIKTVALSMNADDKTVIAMIKAGCCAYLLKDTHPDELEKALDEIYAKGYYNADMININYRRLLLAQAAEDHVTITEREKEFLQLACSDMTYKQIAGSMGLAERTVDGHREALFKKFNVQSRVGLALEAIRRKMVQL